MMSSDEAVITLVGLRRDLVVYFKNYIIQFIHLLTRWWQRQFTLIGLRCHRVEVSSSLKNCLTVNGIVQFSIDTLLQYETAVATPWDCLRLHLPMFIFNYWMHELLSSRSTTIEYLVNNKDNGKACTCYHAKHTHTHPHQHHHNVVCVCVLARVCSVYMCYILHVSLNYSGSVIKSLNNWQSAISYN